MLRNVIPALLLVCVSSHAADSPTVVRLSEPVQSTGTHEIFGQAMTGLDDALPLATLIEQQDKYLGKEVLISARVAKVCQKKGCFFIAQDGRHVARVSFVDYAFFVPTDADGKDVTFAGTLSIATPSAGEVRHRAADLGEAPPPRTAPQPEYAILASAVAVPY